MSRQPLIELQRVDVAHEDAPHQVVLHGVTWTIAEGDWWVVCGGPASGKTALLTVAAGLAPASGGELRILGADPRRASESEQMALRRRIGFVFEGGGRLLGRLSVAENLALPLSYHGELEADAVRERVEALLARAELEAVAGLSPGRLSLALQQRVALLRAVAAPVRVLFLDDPLRGLAPSHVHWWLSFLSDLRDERLAAGEPLALVASAYEFAPWRDHADRWATLEDGRLQVLPRLPGPEGRRTEARQAPPAEGA